MKQSNPLIRAKYAHLETEIAQIRRLTDIRTILIKELDYIMKLEKKCVKD